MNRREQTVRKWARFGGALWAALLANGWHTARVTDDGWAIMLYGRPE